MRRVGVVLLVVVLLAGVAAGGWWAGREALAEPDAAPSDAASEQEVWASAAETTVGRSLSLSTTLRQPARVVAVNGLAGVVTSTSPGSVDVGDTLYTVAEVPVRAVEGETPFYRELALEDEGGDVEQLQEALVDLGYLDAEPDGEFGAATEAALEDWQEDLGLPETGVVPLGELVALESLPTTVTLGESIALSKSVSGGEDAVLAPTGEQAFDLTITEEQLRLIPADATVQVSFEDNTWPAVISGTELDEFGQAALLLSAPGGGPVCGQDCALLPGDELVTLASEVIVVPAVTGIGVPAAAAPIAATPRGTTGPLSAGYPAGMPRITVTRYVGFCHDQAVLTRGAAWPAERANDGVDHFRRCHQTLPRAVKGTGGARFSGRQALTPTRVLTTVVFLPSLILFSSLPRPVAYMPGAVMALCVGLWLVKGSSAGGIFPGREGWTTRSFYTSVLALVVGLMVRGAFDDDVVAGVLLSAGLLGVVVFGSWSAYLMFTDASDRALREYRDDGKSAQ